MTFQLSEEAFEEYISKNSQSGYQVDKGFLVFSISSNLTYTYCPVITEKRVDGDVVTLKVDLIDYDKVDSSKIYKFDEFRIVKKGDYSEDAYMATVNISYKMREDGKIELLHCVF